MTRFPAPVGLAMAAALLATGARAEAPRGGWPHYGNDPGGMRYSELAEITPDNVAELEIAWVHHHGDVADGRPPFSTTSAFQLTPLLVDGTLYGCTPFNRVLALDPATGAERWSHDPGVDPHARYANQLVCRGVAHWRDPRPAESCRRRIFTATLDARLLALDAETGAPCDGFGSGGQVDLTEGVGEIEDAGEYTVTSPPLVAGDRIVVGSAISDNRRTGAPSGVVRAFDPRTGAMLWAWDVAPEGLATERAAGTGWALSTPNVWAPMAYDPDRDLVFLPTGNPTPDYASAHRAGLDTYGSSLVALHGATGRIAWHFQTVHHDVWDFDVPAQPTLFPLRRGGETVAAVVQATKMGLLFTFARDSGAPLFPIEERPVPADGEPGLEISPTQPFPVKPPPLMPHALDARDAWGALYFDRKACRERIAGLRNEGIYTPPSTRGTLMYPGNSGGSNWGGVAVDPERQLLFANVTDAPWQVTLIPRDEFEAARRAGGAEFAPQRGTPFGIRRELVLSPLGVPCNPPPWGRLHAVDLATGEIRWSVPFGTIRDLAWGLPITYEVGVPNIGGPLATASGLVFIGAAVDNYLRAFDAGSGALLWRARLPASPQATPMTYEHSGRQYVVIAAGGHGRAGSTLGDALVAFALPEPAAAD